QYSTHHLTSLSFPTRRSSDLTFVASSDFQMPSSYVIAAWKKSGPPDAYNIEPIIVSKYPESGYVNREIPSSAALSPSSHISSHVDRKSTRLNSSHVSISYAVF